MHSQDARNGTRYYSHAEYEAGKENCHSAKSLKELFGASECMIRNSKDMAIPIEQFASAKVTERKSQVVA